MFCRTLEEVLKHIPLRVRGKWNLSGESYGQYRPVLDIGSKTLHPGVKSVVAKMKDIRATCRNIFALWPTITVDD
jgi:hypothetical protein